MESQGSKGRPADMGVSETMNPERTGKTGYQGTMEIIYGGIRTLKESFVTIGWGLCRIKDMQWYLKEGCGDIYQFARQKFQFSQSTTSRCMGIWRKFSRDSGSPELDARYEGYSISQLTEMLPLEMEELKNIHPEMTVQEIRDKKREILKGHRKPDKEENADEGDNGSGPAISDTEAGSGPAISDTEAGSGPVPLDTHAHPSLPIFQNDMERMEWLGDFEAWGGLWYEDRNIGVKYYRYEFADGSRLIAAGCRGVLSDYDGESSSCDIHYHMVFAENFLERHCNGCLEGYNNYCVYNETPVGSIIDFLKELQGGYPEAVMEEDGSKGTDEGYAIDFARDYISNEYILNEFDPDHLEKKDLAGKSSITRRYAEFYKKHHYIPRYFNANNKSEVAGFAPTLACSCGGKSNMGSIVFFYVVEEIAMIINDTSLEMDEAWKIIKKLLRIAEPSERKKAEEMLNGLLQHTE